MLKANRLTRSAILAAMMAVTTWMIPAFSYGPLQFRFSEALTLLAFYNPAWIPGLTIGVAIANLGSPFGLIDVFVGSFATWITVTTMSKCKNIWLASLFPAIYSFIIGLEILFLSQEPVNFFVVTLQIMISEIVIVTLIGVPLFQQLEKQTWFQELIVKSD